MFQVAGKIAGDRVRGLNLHIAEPDGDILHIDPGVYQDLEKRRRWIRRTVHDPPAPPMPSPRRAQPSTTGNSPEGHAAMLSSICTIISSTRRAPASVDNMPIGALPSNWRFGFRSRRQARLDSTNTCSAIVVIRATRTAWSDSS